MTKLDLLTEFAQCIDEDISVVYGERNECDIEFKVITLNINRKLDFEDCLQHYLLLDLGINYHMYCEPLTVSILHEIGHIINGWLNLPQYLEYLDDCETTGVKPYYKTIKRYLNLDDELFAWSWAQDFYKKNKHVIKRLERELKECVE